MLSLHCRCLRLGLQALRSQAPRNGLVGRNGLGQKRVDILLPSPGAGPGPGPGPGNGSGSGSGSGLALVLAGFRGHGTSYSRVASLFQIVPAAPRASHRVSISRIL